MAKFKAIIPDRAFRLDPQKARRAVTQSLDEAAAYGATTFESLVNDWSNPPRFDVDSPDEFSRQVTTNDPIFGYVDEGTPAHVILPKRGRFLKFQTTAGSEVFARRVNHPGFEGRHYSRQVQRIMQARFKRILDDKLSRLQ